MSISISPARGFSIQDTTSSRGAIAGRIRGRDRSGPSGSFDSPGRSPNAPGEAGATDGNGGRSGPAKSGSAGDPRCCTELVDVKTGLPLREAPTTFAGGLRGRVATMVGLAGARLNFDRRTRGMLAVLMLIVATVAGAVAWFAWPKPEPAASALSVAHTSDDDAGAKAPPVTVSVVGDVVEPGLVEVSSGARVADAIEAAGGLAPDVDSAGFLNLARKVNDGELIVVEGDPGAGGDVGEPGVPGDDGSDAGDTGGDEPPADASQPGTAAPVNLNQATEQELTDLPGIGPVMAARIIEFRDQHGGFDSVDQLSEVDGIGPATLQEISPLVTV
jgi:competence protein ComEA